MNNKLMKTMILMLLPFVAFTQLDTVFLKWENDKYYEVKKFVYEDGNKETKETPIGDTSDVVNYYYGGVATLAKNQKEAVNQLWLYDLFAQTINISNDILANNFGVTVQSISSVVQAENLSGKYKVVLDGKNLELLVVNDSGNLAATIGENSYPLFSIAGEILILSYNDKIYELYRVGEQSAYMTIDRKAILIKDEG